MLSIVITAYKEPSIAKAIESIVNQKIQNYELLCLAPDEETGKIIIDFAKTYKQIKYIKDSGEGKYSALNLAIKESKGDILIFTDGDVWLGDNAINKMADALNSAAVATGRVVSAEERNNMYGYWSHLLTDIGDKVRKERIAKNLPITITGYLWGFKKGVINELPLDIAEDVYASYYAFQNKWRVAYVPDAEVFVKYPKNFSEWSEQKIRSIASARNVKKYFSDINEMRGFSKEASGIFSVLGYAKNFREFLWTIALIFARAYVWLAAKTRTDFSQKWKRIESSK